MFQSSSRIDPRLLGEVEQIEQRTPGYQVLSARMYGAPVLYLRVSCEVLQSQPLNILEEFILRAAIEFDPPMTWQELAEFLGIDELFIQQSVARLQSLGALEAQRDELITTDPGKDYYKRGRIPEPSRIETVEVACYTPSYNYIAHQMSPDMRISDDADIELLPGIPPFDNSIVEQTAKQVTSQTIIQVTNFHNPEAGRIVSRITESHVIEQALWNWGLLVVWDMLSRQIFLHFSCQTVPEIPPLIVNAAALNDWLEDAKMSLADLLQLDDAAYEEFRRLGADEGLHVEATERLVQEEVEALRKPGEVALSRSLYDASVAEMVRTHQFETVFLSALQQANRRVLILAPILSKNLGADPVIEVLQDLSHRNVITLFGWGEGEWQEGETEFPPQDFLHKLSGLQTPNGLHAAIVVWLGHLDNKHLLIDRQAHLSSAYHWVTYENVQIPAGESVYRITVNDHVAQVAEDIETRFVNYATSRWDEHLMGASHVNFGLLEEYLTILIALGRFEEAVRRALMLTGMPYHEFTLLIRLCQYVGNAMVPEAWSEMLDIIGDSWHSGETGIIELKLEGNTRQELVDALYQMATRLLIEDELALRKTLELYQEVWLELGLLEGGSSLEGFIDKIRAEI